MRVIGTAGHVDHGKSTLVHALTGIDPDRLKEEKARGMTIDLGFAWIELPGPHGSTESVGIVDVPGHIDFIKNMLAGVGGIDAALLVIGADEGVMPQTREHLAILDLLAVSAGVVALTKTDLIDEPEWLDLVELDIYDLLQSTRLADAPIVRVSAITGAGLDDLRRTLRTILDGLPPRTDRARPRLPIDRIFSLSGLGTIVTGTLSDGRFTVGDAVEVLPDGPGARIRGLQTHKRQVWNGEPGSRLAINLSGVGTDELHRGQVVVKPGSLRPTSLIDVSFRLLTDTPKPLRHNQLADLFVGAAEVPVHVRVLGQEAVQAGEEGWLQLRLDRPVVVVAGDRFILRQPSPSRTLGGGVVLSPHPRRRWRRFDDKVLSRFQTLARGAPDAILLQTLARLPFAAAAELIEQSDLDAGDGRAALSELRAADAVQTIGADADLLYVTLEGWTRLVDAVRATLQTYHAQSPLRRGMPRGEIRSRLQTLIGDRSLTTRDLNAVLAALQIEALVEGNDAHVWLADFSIALTLEQQAAIDQLLAQFGAAPYAPPNLPDSLRQLGHDEELLAFLIEDGRLVRLGGDVLLRSQDFQAMVERIQAHLRDHGSITLAETRDLFQTSRKYAQSVLEEMDARRITRREGDVRVLR